MDESMTKPLVGTIMDTVKYADGDTRLVVMFDREAIEAAGTDPDTKPPGGEFSPNRLALIK
jgi:hypothetical protein